MTDLDFLLLQQEWPKIKATGRKPQEIICLVYGLLPPCSAFKTAYWMKPLRKDRKRIPGVFPEYMVYSPQYREMSKVFPQTQGILNVLRDYDLTISM